MKEQLIVAVICSYIFGWCFAFLWCRCYSL